MTWWGIAVHWAAGVLHPGAAEAAVDTAVEAAEADAPAVRVREVLGAGLQVEVLVHLEVIRMRITLMFMMTKLALCPVWLQILTPMKRSVLNNVACIP